LGLIRIFFISHDPPTTSWGNIKTISQKVRDRRYQGVKGQVQKTTAKQWA